MWFLSPVFFFRDLTPVHGMQTQMKRHEKRHKDTDNFLVTVAMNG
jgi:hypothetical protein